MLANTIVIFVGALLIFSMVLNIVAIGVPRQPITSGLAAGVTVLNLSVLGLLFYAGGTVGLRMAGLSLMPTVLVFAVGPVGTILSVGKTRKSITRNDALRMVFITAVCVGSLAYFLVGH